MKKQSIGEIFMLQILDSLGVVIWKIINLELINQGFAPEGYNSSLTHARVHIFQQFPWL